MGDVDDDDSTVYIRLYCPPEAQVGSNELDDILHEFHHHKDPNNEYEDVSGSYLFPIL